jgi:hypothetical protein
MSEGTEELGAEAIKLLRHRASPNMKVFVNSNVAKSSTIGPDAGTPLAPAALARVLPGADRHHEWHARSFAHESPQTRHECGGARGLG